MDNLQDLDDAIISSIAEQSLVKINDYFERSSFGAKHLNSKTLSILLSSLEKYKSNEEKVVNVKCVLNCLKKFLELKSNSISWEQLSENISKICELCFCISVKLNDKDLIELNISVLEQMIQVNKNLTNHIFGYLLDPCLTALSIYHRSSDVALLLNLSIFTSLLCENTSRMKRNEIVPTVTHHLNTLSNLLTFCGDYEIQAAIVEVLARCKSSIVPSMASNGSNEKLNLFSCSKKLGEEFNKYSFVKFDPECRMFLNTLNENLGDKRQVYSVSCICIVHNSITLKKPKDPDYKSFWVDFNIARKRVSFYHELKESNWALEYVPFEEVVNVIAKDSICTTKYGKQNIESVKVEFSLCKNIILHERIELLKIYCRKIQFEVLHRVLAVVFRDIYVCEVDFSLKAVIDHSHNLSVKFNGKELSNPKESSKSLSPRRSAGNCDEIGLAMLEQNMQHNTMHIASSTEKQYEKRRETFTQINSNISEEVHSNHESSLSVQVNITKNHSFDGNNSYKIKPMRVINMKHGNHPIEVNNDIKKSPEMLKRPSSVDMSLSESRMNYSQKHPAGHNCPNTKESTVKRKRLYSIEKQYISENSIVLSSQDEQQPLSEKASLNKRPTVKEKKREKDCFLNKNIKRRKFASQNNNPFRQFSDKNRCDDSKPCLNSETPNHGAMSTSFSNKEQCDSMFSDQSICYSKRVDNKLIALNRTPESTKLSNLFDESEFSDLSSGTKATSMKNPKRKTYVRRNKRKETKFLASLFPSGSDPDYKPTCDIKETEWKVSNKRVLRNRNKLLNKVDVIDISKSNKSKTISNDDTSPCLMETNEDCTIPIKLKKYDPCLRTKQSPTKHTTRITDIDDPPTSNIKENNYSLKKRLKGSQRFLNTIVLSRIVEPTRDEPLCNDIEINAIPPEDSEIMPRKIKTYEAQCEIKSQAFVPGDVDLIDSEDFAVCDELSASKLKFNRLAKGKPLNLWNMKLDEMSLEIHSEPFCQNNLPRHLTQSTFKVDDILEFSQKSVLNLKNNINTSIIQSQEKRQTNLFDYDLKLQTSRSYILANCERLEINCSKLNKLKASLDEISDSQQDLIIKIQSEMANLEEAKEQLFKEESEVKKSETFSIMNIFKGIGTYVRRLLLTSFREHALTS